jgi:molybdopterin/thiamine biosynthesis adenylyltransferase/rhodanese-related sulfurtransferase
LPSRQIIHDESQEGREKAISAAEHMSRINSTVPVNSLVCKLTAENAEEILAKYDLVVDATDNIDARYLINDCCVLLRKPLVSGSAVSMDGQITTIIPYTTPCYRCLYPSLSTTMGGCRSCADAGVLGPIPGLIGCLQAIEVMKVLLNKDKYFSESTGAEVNADGSVQGKRPAGAVIETGTSSGCLPSKRGKANGKSAAQLKPLLGRQVLYDAVSGEFHTFQLPPRRADCAVCGSCPSIRSMQASAASLLAGAIAVPSCSTIQTSNVNSSSPSSTSGSSVLEVSAAQKSLPLTSEQRVSVTGFSQALQSSSSVSLILDVRSAEQFSILHLSRPGIASFSSLDACLEGLKDGECPPDQATAVQVNLPLGLLRGGKVASERETSQQEIFASLMTLLGRLRSTAEASLPVNVFVLCRRGIDSVTATQLLIGAALEGRLGEPGSVLRGGLRNVDGGLTAWSAEVDTSMVMY